MTGRKSWRLSLRQVCLHPPIDVDTYQPRQRRSKLIPAWEDIAVWASAHKLHLVSAHRNYKGFPVTNQNVCYLVFDIESVADGELVSKVRYPGEGMDANEAVARYRAELLEKYESDFIPYTFQIPVSVVIAKVSADLQLIDLVALDEPEFRSHVITEHFWRGWDAYQRPTLVSFNGRSFDVPLMELAAFRYGLSVPRWFDLEARSYDQHRNRYNTQSHLDLYDILTNFGATRFNGGLNLAANILGKPGKMEVQGYMVQDMWNEGQLAEINDYCRCDVLDTYFVFLRSSVLLGRITIDREQTLIEETKSWLVERADQMPVYQSYLDQWGDWRNPWVEADDRAETETVESAE